MEELQRKIEEAPKLAEAEQERQRQERIERATTRRSPLDSPDILQDSRHGEDLFAERPRRQRRAQRRQARLRLLISSLAVLILVAIVIFLAIQMFNHMLVAVSVPVSVRNIRLSLSKLAPLSHRKLTDN